MELANSFDFGSISAKLPVKPRSLSSKNEPSLYDGNGERGRFAGLVGKYQILKPPIRLLVGS